MNATPPDDIALDRLEIRLASHADADRVRSMLEAGRDEGVISPDDAGEDVAHFEDDYLTEDGLSGFWLAFYEGELVGMIGARRRSESVAEIRRLHVRPRYRRKGVGSRLLGKAVSFCRDRSYLKVILDTRVEAEPAIRLFEKFGFALSRTREIHGRQRHDFYFDLYRDPKI